MNKHTAVAIFFLFASLRLGSAFEWPLDRVILTASFAESRGDHFHSGIDLGGGEQPVRPIAAGELVFSYEEHRDYTSVPTGLGNFIVLQHEGAIRSSYSHLKQSGEDAGKVIFDVDETLGLVGDTGYSLGRHLHLSIIDSEMSTVINPLLLLPPLTDTGAPIIRNLYLSDGKELIMLQRETVLDAGQVTGKGLEVLAAIYDLREDVSFIWKLAPYKIFLYQDGKEISSYVFDSLHEYRQDAATPPAGAKGLNGALVLLDSSLSHGEVYSDLWLFRIGRIKTAPGETTLQIVCSDFSGNESSKEILLTIK
ncbi:MAG TPA: M23 family metallopeptidase [bacterium]|nr:M23 family metallopeptidase [bacterium]